MRLYVPFYRSFPDPCSIAGIICRSVLTAPFVQYDRMQVRIDVAFSKLT